MKISEELDRVKLNVDVEKPEKTSKGCTDKIVIHLKLNLFPNLPKYSTGWRSELGGFLQSNLFQKIVLALLFVDIFCVCGEMIIHSFVTCNVSTFGNCSKYGTTLTSSSYSDPKVISRSTVLSPFKLQSIDAFPSNFLPKQINTLSIHVDPFDIDQKQEFIIPGCIVVTKRDFPPQLDIWEQIFHYTSLAIVSFFALESILLIISIGCSFFVNFFYMMDLAVVTLTPVFEAFFSRHHTTTRILSVLIITRIWHSAKLFHEIALSIHEVDQSRLRNMTKQLEKTRAELQKTKHQLDLQIL